MSEDVPVGMPFSQVYLRPTAPLKDSQRFRNRLAAYVASRSALRSSELVPYLKRHLGAQEIHSGRPYYTELRSLFTKGALPDVLDTITHIRNYLAAGTSSYELKQWISFVKQVIEEEAVGYVVDEGLGVHPRVDMEFERVRLATVAYLGDARYSAVFHEFEASYEALEEDPPDAKLARISHGRRCIGPENRG